MKLQVFQADKGDCLLLTGKGGEHMLVDGGMADAYSHHVAPALGRMRERGERLDVLYVSHIDADHIAGVLKLLDDEMAWRVHDYRTEEDPKARPPGVPRPPEIRQIWHNSFHDLLERNAGPIEDLLAARAAVLAGAEEKPLVDLARSSAEVATSIKQAIRVSRRVSAGQLGIPLNRPAHGHLMMARKGQRAISVGRMRIRILAPYEAELEALRHEWNEWLKANEAAVKALQARAAEDEKRIGGALAALARPMALRAELLHTVLAAREADARADALAAGSKKLGDIRLVTPPNLASLMLLVEEDGKRILLTGDGHASHILKGLARVGALDHARIHVEVLKVQHHGSEHNLDKAFARAVTADHYVFCGNGKHQNPDPRVVEAIAAARAEDGTDRPFTLWFNSSAQVTQGDGPRDHMAKLEAKVDALAAGSGGRLRARFLHRGSALPEIEV